MPKPKPNHPWKNAPNSKVHDWAKRESDIGKFTTNKRGGGLPPWNTTGQVRSDDNR